MRAAARPSNAPAVLVVGGAVLLALLSGIVGGAFGYEALALGLLLGVPAIALLVDQRLGLLLFILLVPYNGAESIPRLAQNVVFFGVAALFVLRLLVGRVAAKDFALPLPREFVLYALMFTGAAAVGVTHLKEITPAYLFTIGLDKYGLKEFLVGVYARQFTLIIMAATIIWLMVAKRSRPGWIINAAFASGALFVVMMLAVLAVRGFPLSELRTRSFFMILGRQSNSLGGLLLILLGCALYTWEMATGALRRTLLAGLIVLLVGGIVMSASRGALLSMVVLFAIYVLEFRRLRVAFLGALLLSLAALLAPDAVKERMFQGFEGRVVTLGPSAGFDDEVTSGRLYIWSRLAPEVLKSPLIGRGLTSAQWSDFARSGEYFATHPHSFYLGTLMDTGIVGAIIVFLFYRYLWRTFRSLGADSRLEPHVRGYFRGSAAALLAYLVFCIPNGYWYPSQDQVFLWVAAGLAIGMRAVLPAVADNVPAAKYRRMTRASLARRASVLRGQPR